MSSSENETIRVLIADGDPRVCRALVRLLQSTAGIAVVSTAEDATTALSLTAQLHPDVALVDAGSTALGGLELTRQLHQLYPEVRIIVLSIYATFSNQALAAGACRFLLKDCGRDELVAAIRLAAHEECLATGIQNRISTLN